MPTLPFPDLRTLCSSGAAQYGGRVAGQHGARRITYAELFACAERFGAQLRSQGLRQGDFAVLMMENSLAYMVALFAVFAAGAVAVPINADTPASELDTILSDCGPRVLITRERIVARLGKKVEGLKIVVVASPIEIDGAAFGGTGVEGPVLEP